jgi:hypothetical protein
MRKATDDRDVRNTELATLAFQQLFSTRNLAVDAADLR